MSRSVRVAYDGDNLYDFETELTASTAPPPPLRSFSPLGSAPGFPVSVEALRRHVEKFGPEGVAEVAAWVGLDYEAAPKPKRNANRIKTVQRLYKEHHSLEEIAFRTDLTLQTVKKYLREPSEHMEESGPKVHSPASKAEDWPRQWDTPRKRALGGRIIALRRSRLRPMAVASRLGKSDVVVRRYLREAEAAGLI